MVHSLPRTGAIQIVEVRELVEEAAPARPTEKPAPALFAKLDDNTLLSIGVSAD